MIGWLKGNSIKKKYEEKYQEDIEKIQREAEKAQKVFQATGLATTRVCTSLKDNRISPNAAFITFAQSS